MYKFITASALKSFFKYLSTLIIVFLISLMSFSAFFGFQNLSANAQVVNDQYRLPFKKNTNILVTQGCIDGYSSANCIHSGLYNKRHSIDFSCYPEAYDILSIANGTVIETGFDTFGYGHYIKILHENGQVALYAHFQSKPVVTSGKVIQGQKIGNCGSTGNSTGRHLHIELRADIKTFNSTPIFFSECRKGGCIFNQLAEGKVYTSDNNIYISNRSFVSNDYSNSPCFDSTTSTTKNKESIYLQTLKDCLSDNGYLNTDKGDPLISNIDLNLITQDIQEDNSMCMQYFSNTNYQIGQTNRIIENLQNCLISLKLLNLEKATGYYGTFTEKALIEARKIYTSSN